MRELYNFISEVTSNPLIKMYNAFVIAIYA